MRKPRYCHCGDKLEKYVYPSGGYSYNLHYMVFLECPKKHANQRLRDHYVEFIKDLGEYAGPLWQ